MNDIRIRRLREYITNKPADAFLISNFYNILYFTGFKTLTTNEREAFVLVTNKHTYIFTDTRYSDKNEQVKKEVSDVIINFIEPEKGLLHYLQEISQEENLKNIAFESDDVRVNELSRFRDYVRVMWIPTEKIVVKIREIKEEQEIEYITKACEIGDQCLLDIVKYIQSGTTEKELAFHIEMWLKEKGHDTAFDPIVAFDKNTSVPHYHTKDGEGVVDENSIILIDFGVKYHNYLSDITRMFFLGRPSEEVLNVYNILLTAQSETVEQINFTSDPRPVDTYCRSVLAKNAIASYPHSTGHGVGLEIHEYPKISPHSLDIIKPDQVFTIEPGVYFENKWGIRIEDTVVIDSQNKAKTLTHFQKKPFII